MKNLYFRFPKPDRKILRLLMKAANKTIKASYDLDYNHARAEQLDKEREAIVAIIRIKIAQHVPGYVVEYMENVFCDDGTLEELERTVTELMQDEVGTRASLPVTSPYYL